MASRHDSMVPTLNSLTHLRDALVRFFSDEELAMLCQDLGVDQGDLPGGIKASRAAALLQYLDRRGRLEELLSQLEQARANVEWRALAQTDRAVRQAADIPRDKSVAPIQNGTSPFRGLEAFRIEDAEIYFGREQLIAMLTHRLQTTDFLAIVGASGSGKSSLALAGIIATLRGHKSLLEGALPDGSHDWPVHVITPKVHPLAELAKTLTPVADNVSLIDRLDTVNALTNAFKRDESALDLLVNTSLARGPAQRLVLVVDQFEELFTMSVESERDAFVNNLLRAVSGNAPGATTVILTLRADFYERCARYSRLRQLLETNQAYIGPLSQEELRRTIEEPARWAGLEFEPGLVDTLVEDVNAQPGALPLLSHALLETWKRRRERLLTHQGYRESGRVAGAIARTADEVFRSFSRERQAIARRTFLRLITLGEGTEDTRRRATYDELIGQPTEAPLVDEVLQRLSSARLITSDRGAGGSSTGIGNGVDTTPANNYVEVAHEALIGHWQQLQTWLDESRDGLRIQRQLGTAASEWGKAGHDPDALYRGTKLAQAGEWAATHPSDLSTREREFLTASQVEAQRLRDEREALRQRELQDAQRIAEMQRQKAETEARAATRLRQRAMYLAVALVFAVVAAVSAALSARQAQHQASIARARELMSQAEAAHSATPLLGLRLALESLSRLPTDGSTEKERIELTQNLDKLLANGRVKSAEDVVDIEVSKDHEWIAIGYKNQPGELRRMSALTDTIPLSGFVRFFAFSPDENWLAIDYKDRPAELRHLERPNDQIKLTNHGTITNSTSFQFSPDSKWVVVNYEKNPAELRSLAGITEVIVLAGELRYGSTFSNDSKWLAIDYAGRAGELRSMMPPHEIVTLSGQINTACGCLFFSPDSSLIGIAYPGKPGELRQLTKPTEPIFLTAEIAQNTAGFSFSPDRIWVGISYVDKPGELRTTLQPSKAIELPHNVTSWKFSPNGHWVVLTYDSNLSELRSLESASMQSIPFTNVSLRYDSSVVKFSSDDRWLLTTNNDGTNELRNLDRPKNIYMSSKNVTDTYISMDASGTWLALHKPSDKLGELHAFAAFTAPIFLTGSVSSIEFLDLWYEVPSNYPVFVQINRENKPTELRILSIPNHSISIEEAQVSQIIVSPDTQLAFINYYSQRAALKSLDDSHPLSVDLGFNIGNRASNNLAVFDNAAHWLFARYNDNRLDWIDVQWLRALQSAPTPARIKLTCDYLQTSGLFQEAELTSFLRGELPQACQP